MADDSLDLQRFKDDGGQAPDEHAPVDGQTAYVTAEQLAEGLLEPDEILDWNPMTQRGRVRVRW